MSDLISRAEAIEAIESRHTEQWIDSDVDYNMGLETALCEIKVLPSAEPEYQHSKEYVEQLRGERDFLQEMVNNTADRPKDKILEDGTLVVKVEDATKVSRVIVEDDKNCGGLYYGDRPNGEWLKTDKCGYRKCSACEIEVMVYAQGNFCPNCGADMRGGEE